MNIFWIVCLVILVLILLVLGGYILIGFISYHLCLSRNATIKKKIEKNYSTYLQSHSVDEKYFENGGFKKLSIISEDGLKLYGFYKNNKSNKLAILVHGYGGNHNEHGNYAKYFEIRGYDILAIDMRCHGQSEGDDLTMGEKESDDLILWIKLMLELNAQYKIVLFGVSMGATTVCMACGKPLPSNVVLAVEDCGYDNAYNQFQYVYFNTKLHSKMIFKIFYNFTKKSKGFDLKKADGVSALKNAKIPVLFIHGGDDKFVPTKMVYSLSSALPQQRCQVYIAENAGHVGSYAQNPKEYESQLTKFLSKYYM